MSTAPATKEWFDFKKKLEELRAYHGRGTELISVYMPPEYPVNEMMGKLKDEYGQASNIKSATTKKNVQSALEKVMNFLKGEHHAPLHGIAVFCGNVSEVEGRVDIQLHSVIPPAPIRTGFYRCESTFVLEPLEDLLGNTGTFCVVVLDGKEATIGVLKGKSVRVIRQITSTAHAKVSKGGQSARRFQRIHEESVEVYYKRIGEVMEYFLGLKGFKGVIIGGPGPAKEDFAKSKPFNYQLKVLGVVDTGYTDEYGLREIVDKSAEILAEQESVKEKKLIDDFMQGVMATNLATYGYKEVKEALESKKASKLLLSEGLDLKRVKVTHEKTGVVEERVVALDKIKDVESVVDADGGARKVDVQGDVYEELLLLAEKLGIPVEIVSVETHEGSQFAAMFHGIGAFLRYR